MLFTSPEFLFAFLPVVYVGFLALKHFAGHRAIVGWLIAASMVFYAWWSPRFLLLLVASMCVNYGAGLLIERHQGFTRKAVASAATTCFRAAPASA